MVLDLPTLAIIVGWVLTSGGIVWMFSHEMSKLRAEIEASVSEAKKEINRTVAEIYARSEDMRVLETKYEGMRETLTRIENGIKEIKIKLEVI